MQCQQHSRTQEFICFKCNSLMCSKCITVHSKQYPEHSKDYDHIDDIKDSLLNLRTTIKNSTGDGKSVDVEISSVHRAVELIWERLKSSSIKYQSLSLNENEIHDHFRQLYEYISLEELKLMKNVQEKKAIVQSQSSADFDHLKNFISLGDTESNHSIASKVEYSPYLYSIESIMNSISMDQLLRSFIDQYNNTLFNDSSKNINLLSKNNNDVDSIVLDLIHKFNQPLLSIESNCNDKEFENLLTVTTKPLDFNQLNLWIHNSIKVEPLLKPKPESI